MMLTGVTIMLVSIIVEKSYLGKDTTTISV